jgi:acetolactate synthase I/II/III large subunit
MLEKSKNVPSAGQIEVRDVGEAIVASMIAAGIDHLFFASGTEMGFYQEAVAKARAKGAKAPRLILMTHEYRCLNAALGYAAVSGKPAVTTAHVDVGTQHHGCALHTAWRSGLPVLMTAGAPATSPVGSMYGSRDAAHFWLQQTFDQNGIVRQYTKWDHRLEYQDNPGLMVSRALQVACTEPLGPVYLSLPREIVYREIGETSFSTLAELGIPKPAAPDPDSIAEIAERLVGAENPMLVTGTGCNPEAVPALVELCELLGLPVIQCAWQAYMPFPFDHPLFQGKRSLAEADVVVSIESEMPWMPGPNAPNPAAYVRSHRHRSGETQDPHLRVDGESAGDIRRAAGDPRTHGCREAVEAAGRADRSAPQALGRSIGRTQENYRRHCNRPEGKETDRSGMAGLSDCTNAR